LTYIPLNSIFLVRNNESDNFSDQALPVVDYRDEEPTLVLEALRSAHTLASQVEGLSEDEVEQVRNKIEGLADEEFDEDIGSEQNSKNDATMSEDDTEEPESKSGSGDGQQEDIKSLSEDVEELKSAFEQVKEDRDQLEEENEQLKSEIQDLKRLEEIKSETEEIKSLLEDVELEDGPRTEQKSNPERFEEQDDSKAEWKSVADKLGESYLSEQDNLKAFAENRSIDTQEVKNYIDDSS